MKHTIIILGIVALGAGCQDPSSARFDYDGDGVEDDLDCEPADPDIHPGARDEYGDGLDTDCDACPPGAGDGVDRDCDGYPANLTLTGEDYFDCDDGRIDIHPGADDDVGDQEDSNCDGSDGEDADGDTYASVDSGGDDCNDEEVDVHPLTEEVCGDGLDNDCSGAIDDRDADADGHDAEDCGGDDCDDTNPLVHPGVWESCDDLDNDCNGIVDDQDVDSDQHYPIECGGDDCDDTDPTSHADAAEVADTRDNDCDGTVDEDTELSDDDGDGYCEGPEFCGDGAEPGDCDDADGAIHPGVVEICGNGLDDDCSGWADDLDLDDDGHFDPDCGGGDCDDADPDVNPGLPETCGDGVDNDCSGLADDADEDFDSFVDTACGGDDCDDTDPYVSPAALESCDGADQDCNGVVDDRDLDLDGHTDCGGGDCDDNDPYTHPGATEFVDDEDNDCDGRIDNDTVVFDDDGDSYSEVDGDCDDGDPAVHPGAAETCNGGVDDDCDPATDEFGDGDGDGHTICQGDCDDTAAAVFPGATELCDGEDNDCDGQVDVGCASCTLSVPTDLPTIQDAIDAAATGDVVCVEAGTYTELIDFAGKDLQVVGVDGAAATVIDAAGAGGVVTFTSGEGPGAVLQGFTLANGFAPRGGGILILSASPTLTQLVVDTCQANNGGGGIYVEDSSGELTDVEIHACTANQGGGMTVVGSDTMILEGLRLYDNNSLLGGGGLHLADSQALLEDVVVEGCSDSTYAAGILVDGGHPSLINVIIADNDAWFGAGIALDAGDLELRNALVLGNGGLYGGGIYQQLGAQATYDNVRFVGNTASFGAGLYLENNTVATITHCTFAGNEAMTQGGGIDMLPTASLTLLDTLFAYNSSSYGGGALSSGGAIADVRYCDVWANTPDHYLGMPDPTGVQGNQAISPQLLDTSGPDVWTWDLHLDTTSPLIDAGDPALFDPDASPSDVGAYSGEFAGSYDLDGDQYPEWWLPGAYDPATSPSSDCADLDPLVYPGGGC